MSYRDATLGRVDCRRSCDFAACEHRIPGGIGYTCALTFTDAHPNGATTEAVAAVLGVSHTRVQQIEVNAMRKLRMFSALADGYELAPPHAVAS
jgi:hypothetical protein